MQGRRANGEPTYTCTAFLLRRWAPIVALEEVRAGTKALRGREPFTRRGETPFVEIRRSALIGSSAASTFDLIEAAEHYPAFLPWCAAAVILARDASVVVAKLSLNYHGLHFDLTTRNPKRRPHWMAIHLERGPFRRFEGEWKVAELAADACKIEFTLHYKFDNALVDKLSGRVFDGIADKLVDAFALRAEQTLGRGVSGIDQYSLRTPGKSS